MTNKHDIFSKLRASTAPITADGWDGCYAKQLSGKDQLALGNLPTDQVTVELLVRGVVDDQGNALFTHADADDLLNLPGKSLQAVVQEILAHNGLGDTDPN